MKEYEKEISKYIDQLNIERKPKEQAKDNPEELERMTETIRKVRILREPTMPEEGYGEKLIATLHQNIDSGSQNVVGVHRKADRDSRSGRFAGKSLIYVTAAVAAAILLIIIPNIIKSTQEVNIAYAMEKALKEMKAYHGIIEVTQTNEHGETVLQSKREVWADKLGNYYLKELSGYSKGLITINNTTMEWQLRPEEKKVYVFPAFPDPYRFTFELGNEVEDVKKALSVQEIRQEILLGRETTVLKVTPDGGAAYQLWLDKETNLPLRRQSAMQNALQVTVSYTEIEYIEKIPEELLIYQLPVGYEEKETNPEQQVTSLEEAEELAGLLPRLPVTVPQGLTLKGIAVLTEAKAVKLYYGTSKPKEYLIILQTKASGELIPDSQAVLGTIGGNPVEVLTSYQGMSEVSSLRWQEKGTEITVFGKVPMDTLKSVADALSEGDIQIPEKGSETDSKPQIEVPVDIEVEENDQKSVDAGHSPWKLDPVFVAHVFANILISPEGIVGDYPIAYENVTIVENDGVRAKAEINDKKSIAHYIYLERLVRKDDTGIWTVVGYDPEKQ